jgi:acetyl-CoA carboxylase/biotin carboxylase 1
MVSRVNLPAAQLQIAVGIPPHRIRHIRKASSEIDFDMVKLESNQPSV